MDLDDDNLERLLRVLDPNRPPKAPPYFWSPPADPYRPSLPYMPGFKAQIQSHVAPSPFSDGEMYGPWPRKQLSNAELETVTQSALVMSHPPLEATTALSDTEIPLETAQFTITSHISVGCEAGAQVVVCTVAKDGKSPFEAVAKIFDALYYRFSHSIASRPRDVTAEADKDYAAEAAAYERLTSVGRASKVTPTYYGSWTFNLPILSMGVQQMRPIHDGPDSFHLSEDYCLEVLAHAMNAYVRVLHCGVEQNDFASRNFLVCPKDTNINADITGTSMPRVTLIDYNTAIVYSRTRYGTSMEETLALPVNPMQWFWKQAVGGDFPGWVPRDWEGSRKPMQEWLVQTFGSEEQRALYEPVAKELKFDEW
ncbi:hypothetical protein J7T55_000884 [Diaporthe amygdali]|uniref:uncharacterized protein n=1 Tax=Phomopsis amygdali TaxID=1214568 RepID=UPI0022FED6DE|nr:uncharacterized protein J7T55_000884 [Diaporthe amygdali]KAJ0120031.1 hypothetical protein J7T55_000884 [Diaporthe amygdali]